PHVSRLVPAVRGGALEATVAEGTHRGGASAGGGKIRGPSGGHPQHYTAGTPHWHGEAAW
ncbi:unnamed protein product, partial [Symbiodinium sp. KB8]